MPKDMFPQMTPDMAARRKQLALDIPDAFTSFRERISRGQSRTLQSAAR
jgi:hypothetical protein